MNQKPGRGKPDLASLLTVAIPTWSGGRPRLQKLLKHWAAVGCRLRIVDGSDKPWVPDDLYNFLNVSRTEYLHMPVDGDDQWDNVRLRFARALTDVRTPFVAVCGDDDVFSCRGLISATQVLLDESRLDVVVGRAIIAFPESKGCLKWRHVHTEWKDSAIWRSDNLFDRVVGGDGMGFYGVGRTEFLSQLWGYVFSLPERFPYHAEYLIKYLTQLAANLRVVDSLIWVRGPESTQINSRAGNHQQMIERILSSYEDRRLLMTDLTSGIQLLRHDTGDEEALTAASALLKLHESESTSQSGVSFFERATALSHRLVIATLSESLRRRLYRFLDIRNSDINRNRLAYSMQMPHSLEMISSNLRRALIAFDPTELENIARIYEGLFQDHSAFGP
jgi:hypothetical protein